VHELIALVGIIAVAYAAAAMIYRPFVAVLRWIEYVLVGISCLLTFGLMLYVFAEVLMRRVPPEFGYDSMPQPGHLELSELLILAVIFPAISYTQRTHGHVGMDLVLDAMAPSVRRIATIFTLIVSVFVCAVVAWFGTKYTYQFWLYEDVTMSPPYFKTWPWAATIALGYFLICFRMVAQTLSLIDPERFPDDTPVDEFGVHQVSD
jgi:TRAP-type C4-dicarboxylate transport system permease small subunit